jgi:hypothetical protein
MLAFASTIFFTLVLFGAIGVIAAMFAGYKDKIRNVMLTELAPVRHPIAGSSAPCHLRAIKAQQPMNRHRSLETAPLRVAA